MGAYLEQRSRIPAQDLIEVSYESLVRAPLVELKRIYDACQLPESEAALERIGAYLATIRDYAPNIHQITPEQAARIKREWRFALEQWPYEFPADIAVPREQAAA
jgi:hypothetical protein